jgi:hypothetical protein
MLLFPQVESSTQGHTRKFTEVGMKTDNKKKGPQASVECVQLKQQPLMHPSKIPNQSG